MDLPGISAVLHLLDTSGFPPRLSGLMRQAGRTRNTVCSIRTFQNGVRTLPPNPAIRNWLHTCRTGYILQDPTARQYGENWKVSQARKKQSCTGFVQDNFRKPCPYPHRRVTRNASARSPGHQKLQELPGVNLAEYCAQNRACFEFYYPSAFHSFVTSAFPCTGGDHVTTLERAT